MTVLKSNWFQKYLPNLQYDFLRTPTAWLAKKIGVELLRKADIETAGLCEQSAVFVERVGVAV